MILKAEGGFSFAVNPAHVVKVGLSAPVSMLAIEQNASITLMYITGTSDTVKFDNAREAEVAFKMLTDAIGKR